MKRNKLLIVAIAAAMAVNGVADTQPAGNADIVRAARAQVGVTMRYAPGYAKIAYPNGDVPRSEGVCVDVVIRALRDARNVDLQKLIHEDMKANFKAYPQNWGLKKTDPNIDHRRVPNQQCYFKRRGWSLKASKNAADYLPGDFVTCMIAGRLPHIMIVSDKKSAEGIPLVIHNIGSGTQEVAAGVIFPTAGATAAARALSGTEVGDASIRPTARLSILERAAATVTVATVRSRRVAGNGSF